MTLNDLIINFRRDRLGSNYLIYSGVMEVSLFPTLILYHLTQKIAYKRRKRLTERTTRTRWVKPDYTAHSRSFSPSLFEDVENDVFVCHVALFLKESNEQAALKTQGSLPAPEKAVWTSNSCKPGQLNVSLIVITWCNDSQSKYSL